MKDSSQRINFYFNHLFTAYGQNCVGRVDGVYDAGCRAYTTCKGGVGTITECKQPMVFNRDTNQCDE